MSKFILKIAFPELNRVPNGSCDSYQPAVSVKPSSISLAEKPTVRRDYLCTFEFARRPPQHGQAEEETGSDYNEADAGIQHDSGAPLELSRRGELRGGRLRIPVGLVVGAVARLERLVLGLAIGHGYGLKVARFDQPCGAVSGEHGPCYEASIGVVGDELRCGQAGAPAPDVLLVTRGGASSPPAG